MLRTGHAATRQPRRLERQGRMRERLDPGDPLALDRVDPARQRSVAATVAVLDRDPARDHHAPVVRVDQLVRVGADGRARRAQLVEPPPHPLAAAVGGLATGQRERRRGRVVGEHRHPLVEAALLEEPVEAADQPDVRGIGHLRDACTGRGCKAPDEKSRPPRIKTLLACCVGGTHRPRPGERRGAPRTRGDDMSKRRDVDSWSAAWSQRYPEQKQSRHKQSRRLRLPFAGGRSSAGRYALASAVVLAVAVTPFAVAQTTSGPQSFVGDSARYVLLARNTRTADGGAGAMACNSNTGNEPCLNMVNKGNGFAAAFRTRGLQGFRLQTSGSGTATPFVLDKNATGLVKFLNADTVDGKSADEIGREPWATVSVTGTTVTLGDHNGATSATR